MATHLWSWPENAFGSIQGDWAALFRTPLSIIIWGKELEKVPQTLPALLFLASLPQLAGNSKSGHTKTTRRPQKINSSPWEPGTSA